MHSNNLISTGNKFFYCKLIKSVCRWLNFPCINNWCLRWCESKVIRVLKMLCDLFGTPQPVGSSLFIPMSFSTLKDMEGLSRPTVYEGNPSLRAIIDCTEFYTQKPSLPSSQRRTHIAARNPVTRLNCLFQSHHCCI